MAMIDKRSGGRRKCPSIAGRNAEGREYHRSSEHLGRLVEKLQAVSRATPHNIRRLCIVRKRNDSPVEWQVNFNEVVLESGDHYRPAFTRKLFQTSVQNWAKSCVFRGLLLKLKNSWSDVCIETNCFAGSNRKLRGAGSILSGPVQRRSLLVGFIASLGTTPTQAADYGTFGAVFPVIEPSLLDTINARLGEMDANGELDIMRDEMQATTRSYANRPRPLTHIGTASTYHMYEVDLSITVAQDLKDHRGVVFAQAGTKLNPLDHSRFSQRLVFIDGDDPDQVAFALGIANTEPAKIILVANVPAVVSRSYPNMIVEEIPLKEQEDE